MAYDPQFGGVVNLLPAVIDFLERLVDPENYRRRPPPQHTIPSYDRRPYRDRANDDPVYDDDLPPSPLGPPTYGNQSLETWIPGINTNYRPVVPPSVLPPFPTSPLGPIPGINTPYPPATQPTTFPGGLPSIPGINAGYPPAVQPTTFPGALPPIPGINAPYPPATQPTTFPPGPLASIPGINAPYPPQVPYSLPPIPGINTPYETPSQAAAAGAATQPAPDPAHTADELGFDWTTTLTQAAEAARGLSQLDIGEQIINPIRADTPAHALDYFLTKAADRLVGHPAVTLVEWGSRRPYIDAALLGISPWFARSRRPHSPMESESPLGRLELRHLRGMGFNPPSSTCTRISRSSPRILTTKSRPTRPSSFAVRSTPTTPCRMGRCPRQSHKPRSNDTTETAGSISTTPDLILAIPTRLPPTPPPPNTSGPRPNVACPPSSAANEPAASSRSTSRKPRSAT